jgi:hypothetical protein
VPTAGEPVAVSDTNPIVGAGKRCSTVLLIQGHFSVIKWPGEQGKWLVARGSSELGKAMILSDTIILSKTTRFVEDIARCFTFSKSS